MYRFIAIMSLLAAAIVFLINYVLLMQPQYPSQSTVQPQQSPETQAHLEYSQQDHDASIRERALTKGERR
ncbi:hypothetical protein SAMN05443529_104166 [Desulfosporosinus hippei DSM 8344]|uniref:Uncharacterized protein n=1 Tax=Desulfosporosinus hippei DSM 8344 TaxID=1121419 RepID=A0A1G7VMA9_9FIRM|nr:hypothetical protein SAMN05443529_104166 [Desulfosporosinus hippei DSM 8344]